MALSMAFSGSAGSTHDEILTVLFKKNSTDHPYLIERSLGLQLRSEGSDLITANKLIVHGPKIEEDYVRDVQALYGAEVDSVEGERRPIELIVAETNRLVRQMSNGKLSDVLDAQFSTASVVLLNTVTSSIYHLKP